MLEDEIKVQAGVMDFQLRVINRTTPEGESYSFGFIELGNSEDSITLMKQKISINGFRMLFKASEK